MSRKTQASATMLQLFKNDFMYKTLNDSTTSIVNLIS